MKKGIHLKLHTNLITIIDKWNTRHGEEEGHRHLQLVWRVAGTDVRTLVIVVGRWNSDETEVREEMIHCHQRHHRLGSGQTLAGCRNPHFKRSLQTLMYQKAMYR